jgi:FtsP/CotA-like multicopper oxidase with cupredoxin domain
MDKRQRITLLGIAAAIAVVAVVIALVSGGGDDDGGDTTTATQATQTEQEQQDTTAQTPTETTPPEPEPTLIRVKGGEAVGGVEDIEVSKGDRVEIDVTADAADEAHLHGYDITKELAPGKTAKFRFKADIEGVFELELHNSGNQLAKITVKP